MSDKFLNKYDNRLVSIVIPCYNEEATLRNFYGAITPVLSSVPDVRFEILCVDDGSQDGTLSELLTLARHDSRFRVLELTRNFGKEAALTAGLDAACGDAVIPMDADLQDPVEMIPVLIDRWQQGAEVVLAHRIDRRADSFIKRNMAEWFYRIHNRLSDVQIPPNAGDFRLMDRKVVEALKRLPERQRFMKGLFAWIGFRTTSVDYVRNQRIAGPSKFSGWKLWNLALEGITSFSTAPLRIWTYIGSLGAMMTFFYAIFIISRTLIYGVDLPGYASILVAILFFGSLQLVSVGLLGEYIGRIYLETKQRPTYLVRRDYNNDSNYADTDN